MTWSRRAALAVVVLAVVAGTAGFVVSRPASQATHTAIGTTIGGLPASDLAEPQLIDLLKATVQRRPAHVTVVVGSRTAVVRPAELGLTVDIPATARRALKESSNSRGRFGLARTRGKDVSPVLTAAADPFRRIVQRLVTTADVAASDGSLRYQDGQVGAVPPSSGQSTTTRQVERALRDAVQRLPLPSLLTVPVTTANAHVSMPAVRSLAERATALTRHDLKLQAGAHSVTLPRADLARRLSLSSPDHRPGHDLQLALDATARTKLGVPLAALLSVPATEPTIAAPVPVATLRAQGSVTWQPEAAITRVTAPGRAGRIVTPDAVLEAVRSYLQQPAPNDGATPTPLTLTTEATPPTVSVDSARGIDALLGTFTTPFQCCQPRVTNIALMAKTLDGTVIAPGGTFSLNGIVGRRTRAKGYVDAPFILDGELSSDVGGGVSQVATTTLNAAFFAGLKLDRHQAHSFYISRYPAGREATVNYPSIDLAWTNTTPYPILLRAATTRNSLTVALYGHADGRTVEAVTGPRQNVAGRDFRIRVTRIVRLPGQPAQTDGFTTTYNRPPAGE